VVVMAAATATAVAAAAAAADENLSCYAVAVFEGVLCCCCVTFICALFCVCVCVCVCVCFGSSTVLATFICVICTLRTQISRSIHIAGVKYRTATVAHTSCCTTQHCSQLLFVFFINPITGVKYRTATVAHTSAPQWCEDWLVPVHGVDDSGSLQVGGAIS
jgi:hypothetical protein